MFQILVFKPNILLLLFNVLLDKNVCPYIARLLCYMYLNQNCCVKWNSKNSTDFSVSNGVKQGAVISPILFSSYMDALFDRLKRNAIGCHVGPVAGALTCWSRCWCLWLC